MAEKTIHIKNRDEWRAWLEKNHLKETKVAVINHKKHTGKPSMSHRESMEEAICFGWIDTTIKKLDEDRYLRRFSKRSAKGRWSENTLSYAKEMIKQGKMFEVGLKAYKDGLTRPTLDSDAPKNPDMPDDLKAALQKNPIAKENFAKFTQSYKRMYLRWILRAKTPETRSKRVAAVVDRALENRKKW